MTLRQYLLMMLLGTALAWGAVGLIMTVIDPTKTGPAVFVIFYVSLFLALVGTFSVFGFVSRVLVLNKRAQVSRQVAVSFRQAVMLSVVIVAAVYLQSRNLLTWWNAIMIAAAVTFAEAFFISVWSGRA